MSVDLLSRSRLVVAYHGCERSVGENILLGREPIRPSENDYDWLGRGVYFWEHSPSRALHFANEKRNRRRIKTPFVLGAYINLGNCLDLCDIHGTMKLSKFFTRWEKGLAAANTPLPQNQQANPGDNDLLLRFLDCAVLNGFLQQTDEAYKRNVDDSTRPCYYQSVRGVFVEGNPVFSGSKILTKTHTQISVRDTRCILGFFRPNTGE